MIRLLKVLVLGWVFAFGSTALAKPVKAKCKCTYGIERQKITVLGTNRSGKKWAAYMNARYKCAKYFRTQTRNVSINKKKCVYY